MRNWIKTLGIIIAIALVFSGGFLLGRYSVNDTDQGKSVDSGFMTFYAEIDSIDGNTLLVSGLDVNDINFRGAFYITVSDATMILWRGTDIALSDLSEGATISITFSGPVMESYPAQIRDIDRVILLDDSY